MLVTIRIQKSIEYYCKFVVSVCEGLSIYEKFRGAKNTQNFFLSVISFYVRSCNIITYNNKREEIALDGNYEWTVFVQE